MITYQNLYLDIRRQFLRAGFPGAGLEAREIVCFGSGKTREEFYRDSPLYTSPEIEEAVRALAERHTGGEPVAYLIGEWEFYGLTLEVTPAVLIPRTDTEVLAEAAVEFAGRMERCRLLDLCTGSGCVGLAAAANVPGCRVLLGDVSGKALEGCRRNVPRGGPAGPGRGAFPRVFHVKHSHTRARTRLERQLEAETPDRLDVGVGARGAQLVAEVGHVHVDRAVLGGIGLAPHQLEQLLLGEHALRM